jgi:hypothetical protein
MSKRRRHNSSHGKPRRGGFDPGVPQHLTPVSITSKEVATGHTWDFDDPGEPILVPDDSIISRPDSSLSYLEGRCPSCVAGTMVARDPERTLVILQHERGCPWMEKLLAIRAAL